MQDDDLLADTDVRVLAATAGLFGRLDPVPAGLADRMQFAINVAQLEAEVAEITREAMVGVRGDTEAADTITFTSPSISLMVSTAPHGRTARVDGWVTYGGAQIEVVCRTWSTTVTADASGRFSVEDVPRGPVHFVVRGGPGNRPVVTPTVDL